MNNQMTLQTRPQAFALLTSATKKIAFQMRRPLKALTNYYSQVLDRPMNTRQTLSLLEVQAAFCIAMVPAQCPLLFRVLLLIWAVVAVLRCRKVLKEEA
ncbi:MAG: hypothetical protein K5893_09180 [Prevotella sp.]|nr:hypothetical protein [Prevotella sp.]